MRILVTGGAGFIGSHLCERLVQSGQEVICMDNFFTGSKKNVYHLLDLHNFEVLRHDIISPIDVEIDQIYNLACPASPIFYQFNPVRTIQANVLGVTNMLELAKRTKARILQASTSEVYGDPQVHPQREDYWGNVNPIGVRSCYDEGKRVAEALMMDYHRQHQVDIKIVRIFNTYGPRMALNDGRVVSNFIVQALRGDSTWCWSLHRRRQRRSPISRSLSRRSSSNSGCDWYRHADRVTSWLSIIWTGRPRIDRKLLPAMPR